MIEKTSVFGRASVRDVLIFAGVTSPIVREMMKCPLPGHDDSTASFKIVDNRGFHARCRARY